MRTRKIDRVFRMVKIAAGIGSATWALSASAIEPTASVIEYYNAALNHFFITAYADEAAMLDQGTVVKGWTRTGGPWNAWANPRDDPKPVPLGHGIGTT